MYADAETRPEAIRRHLREYRLSLKTLRDPAHALVKRAGASVTPEAAVFLPDGREVYHGRIDDRCVDFGRERPAPTQHDLEEALNAVLDGKPVAQATTQAIGCYIPDLADGSARNPAQDEQSKSDAN